MKSLRLLGFIASLTLVLASVFAPAEVSAMVPPSVHDFFVGTSHVTIGMATVSLTSISRKERQKSNLGGLIGIYLYGASDFTTPWPLETDVAAGLITSATIPLKAGVVASVLTFDLDSARAKSSRKGKLGYQNVGVSGECKFAGYEAAQLAAIEKTFNEGGVAIAVYKNGTRVVYGASWQPLVFEDDTDSGAKADDELSISFKFTGDGYPFHPPILPAAVVVALPA